ncbi:MAG: hypothetical protein JJT87_19375 [Halomonas sp.]|nr:hypothetical protein [Halomonas sp.]MCC5904078.1 hypothetical protein [Halomonas sp.]
MAIDYEITVYDGTEKLFSKTIKAGSIGVKKLDEMMRCLTARYAKLTGDEIVASFVNKNAKAYHDYLFMMRESTPKGVIYSCGDSVHTVVASKSRE